MRVEDTLEDRGKSYGDYGDMSVIAQNIKNAFRLSPNWGEVPSHVRESLEMIATKISRILAGDVNLVDHWHDVGGYAKLVEERCPNYKKPESEPESKNLENLAKVVGAYCPSPLFIGVDLAEKPADDPSVGPGYEDGPWAPGWAERSGQPMTLAEFQDTIVQWADETFPDRTWDNCFRKLSMEELPEILSHRDDPMEYADLFILLVDMAHLKGVNIAEAVVRKIQINRGRKWEKDPETGLYNHVIEGEFEESSDEDTTNETCR